MGLLGLVKHLSISHNNSNAGKQQIRIQRSAIQLTICSAPLQSTYEPSRKRKTCKLVSTSTTCSHLARQKTIKKIAHTHNLTELVQSQRSLLICHFETYSRNVTARVVLQFPEKPTLHRNVAMGTHLAVISFDFSQMNKLWTEPSGENNDECRPHARSIKQTASSFLQHATPPPLAKFRAKPCITKSEQECGFTIHTNDFSIAKRTCANALKEKPTNKNQAKTDKKHAANTHTHAQPGTKKIRRQYLNSTHILLCYLTTETVRSNQCKGSDRDSHSQWGEIHYCKSGSDAVALGRVRR